MYARRLQILLDEDRHRRVSTEARRRGISVGAVIREAIDKLIPSDLARKRAAARRILAAPDMPLPATIEELKAEIDTMHDRFDEE